MKKKRLTAVAVALVIILSCGFSAFALSSLGIGDVISIIDGVDFGAFPSYNETAWNNLSIDEKRSAFQVPIKALKGSPHLDDDFLNSSQSYKYYCSLIRSGNSADFITSPISTMYGEIMLERAGQADFGLGFFSSGHSGGKFGDGTVADTLNDEFLDYLHSNELPRSDEVRLVSGSDGRYITWRLVTNPDYEFSSYSMTINGVRYRCIPYGFYLYLHDSEGTVIDFRIYCYELPNSSLPSSIGSIGTYREGYEEPYLDISYRLSDNYLVINSHANYVNNINPVDIQKTLKCPWILTDIEQSDPAVDDPTIPVVGVDDNGNTIDLNINSDGVTYEGDTYSIDNSDHSVTINGDKYYITINPSDVDPDYYQKFLDDTLQKYFDNYKPPELTFDPTDIITSLNSIFDSLESFRTDFYTKIRSISNNLVDGFNTLISQLSKISKKLDNILSQLKDINKTLDEITTEQEEQNNLAWLELISSFKSKVGWASLDQSISNISTAFFGKREYSFTPSGAVAVDIVTSEGSVSSSMPSLYFEYDGVKYDIFTCLGSLGSGIDTIKSFISVFLWVGFIISVYRSLPSIIGGVSSFEDHSNNVIVDKSTGEIKRGA